MTCPSVSKCRLPRGSPSPPCVLHFIYIIYTYLTFECPAGIWHTGLIVYGKEYFFGGGLQSMPHEQFVQMHGGVGPTEYIELGSTDLSQVCAKLFCTNIARCDTHTCLTHSHATRGPMLNIFKIQSTWYRRLHPQMVSYSKCNVGVD